MALSTALSRVLGLLRDILFFAALGTGVYSSAFIFAFTLPNLFRRLLGEGALTSALIPVLTEAWKRAGRQHAFQFLNKALTRLVLVLGLLSLLGAAIMLLLSLFPGLPDRWHLGGVLGMILFPYLIFVCLAAAMAAALNVARRFIVPSLSQVWLNLAMIGALLLPAVISDMTFLERVIVLCAGVLVGGVVQVLVPAWALAREGWEKRIDLGKDVRLDEFMLLLLPGLTGAAITQINVAVSRLLAFSLDEEAVAILYLANRLVELPLGVFAIAVMTVIYPSLASFAAEGSSREFEALFGRGFRLILSLTVPAAVGLAVLREPILELLFAWGLFTSREVSATTLPLLIFVTGLPFYALSTLYIRGFHARKDMKTPVNIALWVFVMNLLLSLCLMVPFRMNGLAVANVLSAAYGFLLLRHRLQSSVRFSSFHRARQALAKIVLATFVMGVVVSLLWAGAQALAISSKSISAIGVLVLIPVGVIVYLGCLQATGFEDWDEVSIVVKRIFYR